MIDVLPEPRFPPVIVGCWQLSSGHRSSPSTSDGLFTEFTRIADAGLRTFDCADIYTGVEDFLGEFRRHYHDASGAEAADALHIHTKYVPDYDKLARITREDVAHVIDRSLVRLGVGRLDLVQFAWWDYALGDYIEVAGWLDELRASGKIARLGATNFDSRRLREFADAGIGITGHQVQFSALDQRPEAMATMCEAAGTALLCYGSLAGGFLSDRYLGVAEPLPPFHNRSLVKYRLIIDEYGGWDRFQSLLERLRSIANAHEASVAQVALAYTLTRPAVTSVIVGASKLNRMVEVAQASRLELAAGEIDEIRALGAAGPGPQGPVFGLERDKEGPHGRIMKYNLDKNEA